MSFTSRGTRAAARPLRQSRTTVRQSTRRNASSHDAHHEAGHGESAHHVEAGGTGSESFGKGFYITVASIPILYFTYNASSLQDNAVFRFARSYQDSLEKKERQDVLHTTALEQAISDRAVIFGERANHSRDLRYTEFFNQGSPWNVAAGEGTADLSKLSEYYSEQVKKKESERVERMSAKEKQ